MTSDDRHRTVEAARVGAGLSVQQLWLRYLALGGAGDAFDVDGYLQGVMSLETFQQDVLAQAVNEALEQRFRSLQVPLSATTGDGVVDSGLHDVIDQILTSRPAGSDPDSPSPGDPGRPPAQAPLEQPEG